MTCCMYSKYWECSFYIYEKILASIGRVGSEVPIASSAFSSRSAASDLLNTNAIATGSLFAGIFSTMYERPNSSEFFFIHFFCRGEPALLDEVSFTSYVRSYIVMPRSTELLAACVTRDSKKSHGELIFNFQFSLCTLYALELTSRSAREAALSDIETGLYPGWTCVMKILLKLSTKYFISR